MDCATILINIMEFLVQSIMDWERTQNNEIQKQFCLIDSSPCKSIVLCMEGREDVENSHEKGPRDH